MKRKYYVHKVQQEQVALRGHFFTRKKGEWDLQVFLIQYARGLLSDYHITDTFTDFIVSLISEEQLFVLTAAIAALLVDDITDNDDLRDELDESVNRQERPMLPAMRVVDELFLYIDSSEHRQEVLGLIDKALETVNQDDLDLERIPAFEKLKQVFGLESSDLKIISFLFAVSNSEYFETLVNDWTVNDFYHGMALATGITAEKCQSRFTQRSPLVLRSLVETGRRHSGVYYIAEGLVSYLSFSGQDNLHESLLSEDAGKAFDLESFSVDILRRTMILELVKGTIPAHILLYGKEGSGKSEFAKSIAEASGKKLLKFQQSLSDIRGTDDIFNLSLVTASTDIRNSVIVVDEADDLLATAPVSFFGMTGSIKSSKARINDILDNSQCTIIWIVNRIRQIDASTCRRFSFSVEFRSLSPLAIRRLANDYIDGLPLNENLRDSIISLTGNYGLTAASMRYLRNTLKIMLETGLSDDRILARVKTLFESNVRLVNGTVPSQIQIGPAYSLNALNVSVSPEKLLSCVQRAIARSEISEFDGINLSSKGLRFLFHGESGTGKTELARYMAEKLGRPLLIKRASDILSPWVGVAEHNVSGLFKEAEESRSILLIDEADTFFYDREKSNHSWERSLVNEFLTRMEDFGGILICITNLPSVLDKALARRFHEIVEFHPLSLEGIPLLLSKYYPEIIFREEQIFDLYTQGTLTPGDFGSLKGRTNYMEESEVTSTYIIHSLCEISRSRRMSRESA